VTDTVSILGRMTDSLFPKISIELGAEDASKVVEILINLAALIDPDDPDGVRDAYGQRSAGLEEHLISDVQFAMLRHPLYRADDRTRVAERLHAIAAEIDSQLPPEAPEPGVHRPR
jgi:hypothetical protein